MDDFCGSTFWDRNLTWDTSKPDFTRCFEDTVLVWIPCGFLLIFGTLDILDAWKFKKPAIPNSFLNLIQNAVMLILIGLQISDLAYSFKSGRTIYPADRVAPILKILSYIVASIVQHINKQNGVPSSGALFLFWLLSVFCGVFEFQTLIRNSPLENGDAHEKFWFVITMATYPMLVLELFLNFFSDNSSIKKSVQVKSTESNDSETRTKKKLPKLEPCPAPWASFPSRITFQWFWKIAWLGYKKPLEYDELWDLTPEDKSLTVLETFYKYWKPALEDVQRWNAQLPSTKLAPTKPADGKAVKEPKSNRRIASVLPALWSAMWGSFLFGASFKLVQDLLNFASPQLLSILIDHVNSDDYEWKGYFYAVLLFVTVMVQTFFLSQYFYVMFIVGMRVRSSLIGAIYEKSLIISNAARKAFTVGEIVNLMSVDAQRFVDLTAYINMLWSAPLQISLSLYFLWGVLGPSIFAGLGVLILLIPVSGFMASKMKALQIEQLKNKDKRVKLMNEILSGIKVLKLYAWEPSFQDQVEAIRQKELRLLKLASIWNAASTFVYYTTPFLVSLVTFATYVLVDSSHVLDAQKAFVSLTLFNIMRMPLTMLPLMIVFIIEANVSLTRINKFMNAEEIDPDAVTHMENGEKVISVKNGNFTWGESPTLKNINLDIKKGSLVAIVGTVGSGKSSLLSAILGEMEKSGGSVNRVGSVAYVAQQAWIQNATLKENILFEKDFKESLYQRVVKACALEPDIKILPAGDKTEIGEKGINLSGGQKQRVSLARAVYNNTDLYLLDDPLSAVDSHVGKHLFDKVIGPNGVLKHKTRVIVTHAITYLPHVDNIIVMVDGEISETGTFHELLDRKGAFSEFLEQHASAEDLEHVDAATAEKIQQVLVRRNSAASASGSQNRKMSDWSLSSRHSNKDNTLRQRGSKGSGGGGDGEASATETGEKLIEIEKSETGSVKSDVYWHYLRSLGKEFVITSLVFNILTQGFSVYSNIWLSKWSNEPPLASGNQDTGKRDVYLGVYGGLGIGQAVCILVASLTMSLGCIKAARFLHNHMLNRVLRSPMSFFDTTPLGRIVNRFAKDVDVADSTFPVNLRSWLQCLFQVTATIVVISYSTPWFLAVIIPIGVVYYMTQRFYVATSRQLKRIESVTRSPIYSHFSETLTGSMTIRAFGMGPTFAIDSGTKVDVNQIAYFPSIIANRWLAVRLESVGNLIIFFAALFAVLSDADKGSLGLSVSYALNITQTLNWLVRMTSDVETNVVAIERIKEYGEVEQEAEWEIVSQKPTKDWPAEGNIEFQGYQTRYREGLDLVLRDVTCKVNAGEKVGIVGRTGAGKSSLTVGLFRIVEAAGGKIVIDGVDISKIGLHDVRGKLTIIPQDPVLFSGTLRINLDPFETKTDDELWNALEYAHLKDFVKGLPEGLEYTINEGGENLSVGQRQLVCLARALLRKTKILILDEATAAVDLDTDDLIQQTIRSEFRECTVLTIAHRLNTIMDYNRVMVLDKGEIKEFDSPEALLQDNKSIFYSMAKDAGLT